MTSDASGVLRIVGGAGVNAVALRTADFEPYALYVYDGAPSDFPDPERLQLAATVTGGTGSDTITGGAGADTVSADPTGISGDDAVHMEDGEPDGRIVCGRGADTVTADPDLLDALLEPLGIIIPDLGCEAITRLTPDRTAPALAITAAPPATTAATEAVFAWTDDDPAATETCALDGAAVACADRSARLTRLTTGAHRFTFHAVDAAGNASDAAYAWRVTAPAPVATPEPTATPQPAPAAHLAAAKLKRPAGGRIRLEARNRLTLRFDCPAGCAAQTLEIRAKGTRLPVKLKAGQRTVRVTAPKKLATAIRGAGKRGLKTALTANGTTLATLRLYARY